MKNHISQDPATLFLFRAFIVAVLVFSAYMVSISCRTQAQYIVGGLSICALAVVSIPVFIRSDYSLFEPLTFVVMLVTFGVTFKMAYVLSQLAADNGFVIERLTKNEPMEVFLPGMLTVVAGLCCFTVGYSLRFRSTAFAPLYFPQRNDLNGPRLQVVLLAVTVFSLALLVLFIITNGISFSSLESLSAKRFNAEAGQNQSRMHSANYFLFRGAALSKFVVYLTLLWVLHRREKLSSWVGLWFVFTLLQTCFLSFIISNRAGIVLLLIDCMVITYYMLGRLEIKKLVGGIAAVMVLLIVILSSRVKSDHTLWTLVEKTMAGRDMLDITKTVHIMNAIPSKMEYRNGEMLYGFLAAPIPRSIWRDKPMWAERGPYINQRVYGDKLGMSGVPPGYLAELYWSFGRFGVLVGMFVTGVVFRMLFLSFIDLRNNPVSVLIYTMVVTRFVLFGVGSDLGTGVIKTGLDLVPLLMILWFVSPRKVHDKREYETTGNAGNPGLSVYAGDTQRDRRELLTS